LPPARDGAMLAYEQRVLRCRSCTVDQTQLFYTDPSSQQGGTPVTTQQAASTESFRRYVEAFRTLDPRAALRHLHIPFIFVDDRGARLLLSATEAEALLTIVMDALRIRGYARSDIGELHVYPLNRHAAIISVNRIRYTTAGEELERVGETYTLVQTLPSEPAAENASIEM
jgi:hypothetical protein